jgi:hypothetical protein
VTSSSELILRASFFQHASPTVSTATIMRHKISTMPPVSRGFCRLSQPDVHQSLFHEFV